MEIAASRRSPLCQVDEGFRYTHEPAWIMQGQDRWPRICLTTRKKRWPELTLGLIGEHQACNAAVTLAVVEEMRQAP